MTFPSSHPTRRAAVLWFVTGAGLCAGAWLLSLTGTLWGSFTGIMFGALAATALAFAAVLTFRFDRLARVRPVAVDSRALARELVRCAGHIDRVGLSAESLASLSPHDSRVQTGLSALRDAATSSASRSRSPAARCSRPMTLSAGLSLAAMACAIALLASIASPLGVGLAGGATIGILALLVLAGFLTAQRWAMHTESIAAAESYETSLVTTGLSAIIAGCGEAEVALILREATGGIAEATEPQVVSPRQAA